MAAKKTKYESEIEEETARRALNELGIFSIKIKSAQEKGYPDREFLIPGGKPLFIEFKRPDEEPEPYQRMVHMRLRHFGYEVQVHTSIESALRAIAAAKREGLKLEQRKRSSDCALLRPGQPKRNKP
jgi:hypothetical protein